MGSDPGWYPDPNGAQVFRWWAEREGFRPGIRCNRVPQAGVSALRAVERAVERPNHGLLQSRCRSRHWLAWHARLPVSPM